MNLKPRAFHSDTSIEIIIRGQIRGGKNNMKLSRFGHHYPDKKWAIWRDDVVNQIKKQLPVGFKTFEKKCFAVITYCPGDNRRRDVPAILDAIWHCLERADVVRDDWLLADVSIDTSAKTDNPITSVYVGQYDKQTI